MLAFETIAAWLTRGGGRVKYASLWPVQYGLYVIIGFLAMVTVFDLRRVELIGAITGFVEATLGWWISWRIGPGRMPTATPPKVLYAIVIATVFAFGCTIAGALLLNAALRVAFHLKGF